MKCPRCQARLKRSTIAEPGYRLVIDSCPSCEGMWFSREQLQQLEKIVEPTFLEIRNIPSEMEQCVEMYCPSCQPREVMIKAIHERDKKVIFDHCPSCQGIWLDHGELEAIQVENWIITLGRIARFVFKTP